MTSSKTSEPRPSREATLGADGLHVSRASGTVPASAPDDSRASAYADSESAEAAGDAARGSREASLGGAAPETPAAGGLASEDETLPQGERPGDPDPERDWAREYSRGSDRGSDSE